MTTARPYRPLRPSHFNIDALLQSMRAIQYGVVQWFNSDDGFGFITPDEGGRRIFVHRSEIAGIGPRVLQGGQRVSYRVGGTHKRPEAGTVHVL